MTKNRQGIDIEKSTYTEPITFNELLYLIKDCKNDEYKRVIVSSGLFWRTPDVEQRRIEDYAKDVDKWASTADRIRCESFGYTAIKDENGKLVAQIDDKTTKGEKMVWLKNKYPYSFAEDIHHDVVFFDSIKERDYCIHVIKNKLGPGKQVVWVTNSVESRSVPEIDHIQVIHRDSPFLGEKTNYNTSIIASMKRSLVEKPKAIKAPSVYCAHRMNYD